MISLPWYVKDRIFPPWAASTIIATSPMLTLNWEFSNGSTAGAANKVAQLNNNVAIAENKVFIMYRIIGSVYITLRDIQGLEASSIQFWK